MGFFNEISEPKRSKVKIDFLKRLKRISILFTFYLLPLYATFVRLETIIFSNFHVHIIILQCSNIEVFSRSDNLSARRDVGVFQA